MIVFRCVGQFTEEAENHAMDVPMLYVMKYIYVFGMRIKWSNSKNLMETNWRKVQRFYIIERPDRCCKSGIFYLSFISISYQWSNAPDKDGGK